MFEARLLLPLVNVSSGPVADEDLRPVEQLEVVQQEGQGDEGQGGGQDCRPWRLLDAKECNHDDLEEEHGCDDVLEDLHPQLHQHTEPSESRGSVSHAQQRHVWATLARICHFVLPF